MTTVTATDRTGLGQVLRQLKLSGMLHTLDARLAQAAAGDLGHLDFLQVLCEDEINRRQRLAGPAAAPGPVRRTSHPRRVRLRRQHQAARRADPRPGRPALAARRRIGHPVRPRRRRQDPRRPGPRPPGHPLRRRDPVPQNQPRPGPPGRRPRRPHLGQTAPRAHPPRRAHPRRLRHARTHRRPGRRPLRADHRTRRRVLILTSNRAPADWYPLFPNPRRRRIPARPAHQHQPPGLHERAQLPPEQAPRARRPHREGGHQVKQEQARPWGIT